MIKVTLDTNVLIAGLDGTWDERKTFDDLMDLKQKGIIEIALTSRFDQDKVKDSDIDRVKKHYRIARMFPTIPSSFRLGVSLLGQDCLVDESIYEPMAKLFGIEDPQTADENTLWDIDHLYGHWVAERGYFLTYEKRIFNKSRELDSLKIRVMNPEAFLNAIEPFKKKTPAELDALLPSILDKAFKGEL